MTDKNVLLGPGEEYPEGGLDRASEEAYELARYLEAGDSLPVGRQFYRDPGPDLTKDQILSGEFDDVMSSRGIGFGLVRQAWHRLYEGEVAK